MYKKHVIKTMLSHLISEVERAEHYYYCGRGDIYSLLHDVIVSELDFMYKSEFITDLQHLSLLQCLASGVSSEFTVTASLIIREECRGIE